MSPTELSRQVGSLLVAQLLSASSRLAFAGSDWLTPLSPWSLWVPIALLGLIILAAVYFVRLTIR